MSPFIGLSSIISLIVLAGFSFELKTYTDSQGIAVQYGTGLKKISGSPSRGSGLPHSEIAGNEKHYHDNTNYVENIVHVSFSFLSRDRIYR